MFKGLKDDNEIIKIIGYRSMTINKQMSKEEKEFYKKMKSIHKIPNSKTENEKINQIEEALINGGNLDDILWFNIKGCIICILLYFKEVINIVKVKCSNCNQTLLYADVIKGEIKCIRCKKIVKLDINNSNRA